MVCFHFVNDDSKWDERINEDEIKLRVFPRGTYTKGCWCDQEDTSWEKTKYLFFPYPEPVIRDNTNIKLGSYFRIIDTILNDSPSINSQFSKLSKVDLLDCLVADKAHRDITFVLEGGVSVEAHGLVLAIRSPVLNKMLSSNMVEGKTGRIELLEVKPKPMQIFVDSFYGIDLPNDLDSNTWTSIFWLCEKYQVYFILPKLFQKISNIPQNEIFPELFEIFRKVPLLDRYFNEHRKAFTIGVLQIHPSKRSKAMEDFLLKAHFPFAI